MKICAYLTLCLCLPFVLLAEDEGVAKVEASPDENAEAVETVTDPEFERFKTILDRMPFGRTPPGFDPDKPNGSVEGQPGAAAGATAAEVEASEIEQQILSSVHVSMLNRTTDGRVFVGFTDSSVQPAKNYLLELGEKREQCEWQVVSVDSDCRQVTLSKGGVEATLRIGGGSSASDDAGGKAKNGEAGGPPGARPGIARRPLGPVPPGAPAAAGDEMLSPLERVRAKRRAHLEKQQAEEAEKRLAAEQMRRDREQEMKDREREKMEREMAAEERKAQLAQLQEIQEELRRQRAEKEERRAAEGQVPVEE